MNYNKSNVKERQEECEVADGLYVSEGEGENGNGRGGGGLQNGTNENLINIISSSFSHGSRQGRGENNNQRLY